MPHAQVFQPMLILVTCLANLAGACIALPARDSSSETSNADGGAIWPLRTPPDAGDSPRTGEGGTPPCGLDTAQVSEGPSSDQVSGGLPEASDGASTQPSNMAAEGSSDPTAAGSSGAAGPMSSDAGVETTDAPNDGPTNMPDGGTTGATPDAGDDPRPTEDPAPGPGMPASPGDIVVTEVMADPAERSDTEGEWLELHNPGQAALAVTGCTLGEGEATDPVLPELVLSAGAYAALARAEQPGFTPDAVLSLSLKNSSDVIVLRCGGTEIDRVEYDAAAGFPIVAGASMMLLPAALNAVENDAAEAWCAAGSAFSVDQGTPGAPNGVCAQ